MKALSSRYLVPVLVTTLLLTHALLLAFSIPRNAVTYDEYSHVPAALGQWQAGQFWLYHHNPPFVSLCATLPAVITGTRVDLEHSLEHSADSYGQHSVAREFEQQHRRNYLQIFFLCRTVIAAFSLLGGWLVFCWSRELFGDAGGIVSLALWVFCPNVLAHGGLVTPDVGSAVFAFLATWQFWRYLKHPTTADALLAGLLLGLVEASKFTFVILPFIWMALAAVTWWQNRTSQNATVKLTLSRAAGHAALVMLVSLLVLNSVYQFDGTGKPLGSFDFKSDLLTVERPADDGDKPTRVNCFRNTRLEHVPAPFPKHYLVGIDAQATHVDTRGQPKYLRGEWREPEEDGWWYYYLYGLLVKLPLGTLALLGAAAVAVCFRRTRRDVLSELALLLPAVALLVLLSSGVKLNSHVRYALPVLPFLFVGAGRLGLLWTHLSWRGKGALVKGALLAMLAFNIVSVLRVHPDYLTYFNEAAGGPHNGWRHLTDSNIDWGQGLIPLHEWLHKHAPDKTVSLVFSGPMQPETLGIRYKKPSPYVVYPEPGLHAVEVSRLAELMDNAPRTTQAYTWYRRLQPIARPGNSFYIYEITEADVKRLKRQARGR